MKAVKAVVSGSVHGVGFRQATRSEARGAGLLGWVRNEYRNGTVEVWLQGDDEAVNRMVDWLWHGPQGALVSGVESETVAPDRLIQDFVIRQ
ncbi:MAG TPA: acylphosphatase [Acidimicrobiia bacterium]|nr:acylphosphatase [Acidimicrobiia bacterium]